MADSKKKSENMSAQASQPLPDIVDDLTVSQVLPLVRKALDSDAFMWRTAEGIAQEMNLPIAAVSAVLTSMGDSLIRSAIPDDQGRTRHTTLAHYRAHAGILRRVLDTLSDQVR